MQSSIEWTNTTWNPTTGCSKVSSGCKNCYAERFSYRLKNMGKEKYKNGFIPTIHYSTLSLPYSWKNPRKVFVNSMSDLFHKEIPTDFITKVFRVMRENPRHNFQILTKRSERLEELDREGTLKWKENIWMGVSVETKKVLHRIESLKKSGASVKFLSIEPLLESLKENLDLQGIDWVIVGGESGHQSRPMKEKWVMEIKEQCEKFSVPFFFKQWGGKNKKKNGRVLQGKTFDAFPKLVTSSLSLE